MLITMQSLLSAPDLTNGVVNSVAAEQMENDEWAAAVAARLAAGAAGSGVGAGSGGADAAGGSK
jgi:hypothetical protein